MGNEYTAEISGCLGKQRFPDFATARLRAQNKRKRPRIAYRCRFCGGIHIGERDVERERAKRQIRRQLQAEVYADD